MTSRVPRRTRLPAVVKRMKKHFQMSRRQSHEGAEWHFGLIGSMQDAGEEDGAQYDVRVDVVEL